MKNKLIIFSLLTFLSLNVFGQATGIVYGNYPTGGSFGDADTTVDVNGLFNVNQTTPGQTITLPTPTNNLAGKNITINNIGTTFFKLVPGGYIMPGSGIILRWTGLSPIVGTGWSTTGTGMMTIDEVKNTFYASPLGSTGTPGFRVIDTSDVPKLALNKLLFTGTTGQYINGAGGYATFPTTTKTPTTVTPTLNTAFQISSTLKADVNYSVNIQITSALVGTNTGTVQLQTCATSGGTFVTQIQSGISLAGVVTTMGATQTLSAFVPAGYYVKLVTSATGANAGSAVFTAQPSQQTTY
jgi:hypothetical protein